MVDRMIRLYESTETEFQSNGLGYLPDATECIVTEQRNGIFELKMKYPITGKRYSELQLRRILLARPNPYDDPQPFRIYEITKPMKKLVSIYAEHISYDMSGFPVSPFEAGNVVSAFEQMKAHSVVPCPFTFWTDKSTSATMTVEVPSIMRSLLGGVEGSILDVYGGEYQFDRYLVRLYGDRGANRGVTIRYGKNLTDVQQEENCSAVYTGVYPYWAAENTETGEKILVLSDPPVVAAPGTFNFTRILMLDLGSEYQEPPTPEQLKTRAERYISDNKVGVPKVSIDVSFVDLMSSPEYEEYQLLETVHLCDTVSVEFEELGVKATSKCVKTEYDVLSGTYQSITLGETRGNLASTVVGISQDTKSEFEKMIEREKYLNNLVSVTLRDEFGKEINSVKDEFGNQIITVKDEFGNEIKVVVDEFGQVTDDLGGQIQTVKDEFGNEIIIIRDEFGNEITKIYAAIEALKTEQAQAIEHATKLITGNLGGNVILHSSTGGEKPDELLIMDTDNIATTKRVWRWNLAGLGYSSKGYVGPFALAMTADGVFVADFIQAGTMSCNRLKGGTLTLGGVNNGNGVIQILDAKGNIITDWDINSGYVTLGNRKLDSSYGKYSFSVGSDNVASGDFSVAMGNSLQSLFRNQICVGRWNKPGEANDSQGNPKLLFIIGSGWNEQFRRNSFVVDSDGAVGTSQIKFYDSSYVGESDKLKAIVQAGTGTFSVNTYDPNGGFILTNSYFGASGKSPESGGGSSIDCGSSSTPWYRIWAMRTTIMNSDRRQKKNIISLHDDKVKNFILSLNPVRFQFKQNDNGRYHWGFIAQEVEEALNIANIDTKDFSGFVICKDENGYDRYALGYTEFIAPAIAMIQEQQTRIDILESKVDNLQKQIDELRKLMGG